MRALLALLLLAGCGTVGSSRECSFAQPILVAPDDVLTPETAKEILTYDLQVQAVCGR